MPALAVPDASSLLVKLDTQLTQRGGQTRTPIACREASALQPSTCLDSRFTNSTVELDARRCYNSTVELLETETPISSRSSIRQVAARAKVSAKTVTNVLRERAIVAPETRDRVLEAVRALNYIPVRSAMQNRHVQTHVISVVFDHTSRQSGTGWHSLDMATLEGIRDGAQQEGYDLLINLRRQPEWMRDREEHWLLDRRSDGFIFVNPRDPQRTRKLMDALVRHQIPVVGCFTTDVPTGVGTVIADSDLAMRLAVEHMARHGHSRIAHLAGAEWHSETRLRREGFRRAMLDCGLQCPAGCIIETGQWSENNPIAMESLLRQDFTAVVCWNDDLAVELWAAAEAAGREVPRSLSIIGVDDTYAARTRGLTTVTNPFGRIGREAVEVVQGLINGDAYETCHRRLPVELIERQSVSLPGHPMALATGQRHLKESQIRGAQHAVSASD